MAQEIIKVYAPSDGVIFEAKNGVDFLAKSKELGAPIEGICLQISDDKKQINLQDQQQNIIVIDLGQNQGQWKVQENEKIALKQKIFSFDSESFTKISLTIVAEEKAKYKFKLAKDLNVKQADLILTIEKEKELEVLKPRVDEHGHQIPILFENEWESLSKVILENVGGYKNIAHTMNCATRLRLNIKNLDQINYEEIKKEKKVHGIQLKGDELQIIIGLDVYKLKDAFVNYVQKVRQGKVSDLKKEKIGWKAKLMKIINNIFIPIVPALCAASTVMLLKTILEQTGAITAVGGEHPLGSVDAFSGTVYMLAQTLFAFIGVFFCYNTVKFLKGNQIIGIFIGIVIAAPLLLADGGVSWALFKIGNQDFKIAGYGSAIIPQIAAGLIYVYFDRWIQKWFPLSLDMIFRHAISFLVATLAIFLILGPFLNLIELGVYWVIVEGIGKLPGGIGVGIAGFLWQPLVLTGVHAAVYVPVDTLAGTESVPLRLVTAGGGAVGQFGAVFALIFLTKNSKLRQVSIATAPTALFGITEPAIYGANLLKFWPFIGGCIGSSLGGFYMGALGVDCFAGGGGILTVLATAPKEGIPANHDLVYNYTHASIGYVITIIGAMGSTALMYRERLNEAKAGKKLYAKINQIFKLNHQQTDPEILNDAKAFENIYNKEKMSLIHDLEKITYHRGILQNKLEKTTTNWEHKKEKYAKLAIKAYRDEKWDSVKKYNDLFLNSNLNKTDYLVKINEYTQKINDLSHQYDQVSREAKLVADKTMTEINQKFKNEQIGLMANNFDNVINSLKNEIALERTDNSKLFSMKKYKKSLGVNSTK